MRRERPSHSRKGGRSSNVSTADKTQFSLDSLKIKRQREAAAATSAGTGSGFFSSQSSLTASVRRGGSNGGSGSAYCCFFLFSIVGFILMIQGSSLYDYYLGHSMRVALPVGNRRRQNKPPQPMIPKPGEYAPLRKTAIIPLVNFRRAPTRDYHIFVIGEKESMALSKLTNLLMGLFDEPDQHFATVQWSDVGNQFLTRHRNEWTDNNATIVSQTTETDLSQLERAFRLQYTNTFYFVLHNSHNKQEQQSSTLCQSPMEHTMLCVNPIDELSFINIEDQKLAVAKMVERIRVELPYFARIDFSRVSIEALRRINYMEDMVMQMRDLPLSSSETKYGIKGGTPV